MKKFTKLLGIVLIIALVMSISVSAFAATVEVKDSDNYVADRTFKAYQVFKADWQGEKLTNVTAGEGIDWSATDLWTAVKALGGDFAEVNSADKLLKALDGKDATVGEKIAKILKDYTVAAKGITVANNGTLDDGYYIIIDETTLGENDVANAALLQVAGDKVTINVKTDKPSVEKKIDGDKDADTATSGLVDANNGQVNDLVPYVITSTVPNTTYYDHYYMEFKDTVSAGLDISASNATGDDAFSDYKVYVDADEMDTADYELTVDATNRTISVKFTDVKGLDGKVLKLTYNAKINKAAVVGTTGHPNEVYLKYTNSPDHSGDGEYDDDNYTSETPKDVVITYLTGIQILKVDAKDQSPLEGAEFQIVGTRTVSTLVSGVKFEEKADGTYYKLATGAYTTTAPTTETAARYDSTASGKKFAKVTLDKEVLTETTAVNVSAISGADGIVTFSELGAGEYTITEIVAPTGYNALTDPVTVNISFTAPTKVSDGTEKCTWEKTGQTSQGVTFDTTSGLFKITIENNSGTQLPSTGGIGTTIFYVVGSIMVVAAGVLLITKKRMGRE